MGLSSTARYGRSVSLSPSLCVVSFSSLAIVSFQFGVHAVWSVVLWDGSLQACSFTWG
jgi:hypothetical protein